VDDICSYLSQMIHVNGIGQLPILDEIDQLTHDIELFVEQLCTFIGNVDSRFKGKLIKSGSFYEQTKNGDPDEYDFMIDLEYRCLSIYGLSHRNKISQIYPTSKYASCELLCKWFGSYYKQLMISIDLVPA
ncbi:unnamed protein product, partial [Didymodactylos carnosus]